jgi:hypothetical protein
MGPRLLLIIVGKGFDLTEDGFPDFRIPVAGEGLGGPAHGEPQNSQQNGNQSFTDGYALVTHDGTYLLFII